MYQDQTKSLKVVVCFTFNINGARVAYTVYKIGDSPGVSVFIGKMKIGYSLTHHIFLHREIEWSFQNFSPFTFCCKSLVKLETGGQAYA